MDRTVGEARRLLAEAQEALSAGADELGAWLATPQGRRFRQIFARVLLVSSPLLFRMRFFRATPLGRLIEFAGGTAIIIPAPSDRSTSSNGVTHVSERVTHVSGTPCHRCLRSAHGRARRGVTQS